MQYNFYFYCMAMLYIWILTFFSIVTKRRKIQTRACNKTPSFHLDGSISPNNEINDYISANNERNDVEEILPSFQEEAQQKEQGMHINY